MPRRISNRTYPSKDSKNPACDIVFTPHDRQQDYCEPQCRFNAANDRRHLDDHTRYADEKFARQNSKILELLWKRLEGRFLKTLSRRALEFEYFDFNAPFMQTVHPSNGRKTQWFYDYGLQLTSNTHIFFLRKKIPGRNIVW